jgi:hypothetical protein
MDGMVRIITMLMGKGNKDLKRFEGGVQWHTGELN